MPAFLRILKKIALALLILPGVYLLMMVVLSYLGTSPPPTNCDDRASLYVSTNDIHLYLILPKEQVAPTLRADLNIPAHASYVSFGWGDKDFYLNTPTWDDMTLGKTLKALFLNSPSLVQVAHYTGKSDRWRALRLCPAQMKALNAFLENAFERQAAGRLLEVPAEKYGANTRFYEAKGSYSAFYTCNNWVNSALKNADVKTSIWSPLDFGVLHHLPKSAE